MKRLCFYQNEGFYIKSQKTVILIIFLFIFYPFVKNANLISSGKHSFQWFAKDMAGHHLASGFYIFRLKFGYLARSKRLLLLK